MEKKESMLVDVSRGLEEMEGARRATGISSSGRTGGLAGLSVVPDSEVPEKAVRRRFTAEYKRRVLREAEACKEQGLSLIHISEPTRLGMMSYAVFCLKKKKTIN